MTLIVAERLDVALTRGDDRVPEIAAPVAIPVALSNTGTGEEAFAIAALSSTPATVVRTVAIDRDGDGRFDPAVDTMLAETTPALAPGETLKLLAVIAPAADGAGSGAGTGAGADGELTITARAVTGSGRADDSFAGRGDNGGDAVVGRTGAAAQLVERFAAAAPMPSLVKSQSVRAPDGSAAPVSGAVVTYTVVAHFPTSPTGDARIDDPLPAGTIYLPGTLALDGHALSDVADADAGTVAGGMVTVTLGDVGPAENHEVRFQVRLP